MPELSGKPWSEVKGIFWQDLFLPSALDSIGSQYTPEQVYELQQQGFFDKHKESDEWRLAAWKENGNWSDYFGPNAHF